MILRFGESLFPKEALHYFTVQLDEGKPLPVYGKGENVRDWLYVEDHCRAIWLVIQKGRTGETYNIGGNNEWRNIDIVYKICDILGEELGRDPMEFKRLITFVPDRPGHDLRYAIDSTKIRKELGWKPQETFETGLRKTVKWYLETLRRCERG